MEELQKIRKTLDVYSKQEVVRDFGIREETTGSVMIRNKLRSMVADIIIDYTKKIDKENYQVITIADIGCGNGLLGRDLDKRLDRNWNLRIAAFDFSEEMVSYCIKNNDPKAYDYGAVCIANTLPIKKKSFDVAVTIDMLHHLPSQELQEQAIKEILRISKGLTIFEVKTDDKLSFIRWIFYSLLKLLHRKKDLKKTPLAGINYTKSDLKKIIRLLSQEGKRIIIKRVSLLVDWRIIICS